MEPQPGGLKEEGWNYFSYYTEIEDHFQKVRGTGLFLLSPLDWALIETWKMADIPLEAVLRGIDTAFEKWAEKKSKFRQVNSLAYCAQAVFTEAQQMAGITSGQPAAVIKPPFSLDEVKQHLVANAELLKGRPAYISIAESLEKLIPEIDVHYLDLEALEQRLTALEEKMSAIAKVAQPDEDLLQSRRDLDSCLRPYRGRMTADQLSMLERQFLEKRVIENARLPRLSLFYLQTKEL